MRILGIDPGSLITGYGVIDVVRGRLSLHCAGIFRLARGRPLPERLKEAAGRLSVLLTEQRPDEVCLESVFQHLNVRSVLVLAHLRGALMLELARSGRPLFEYTPREVKKALVGHGQADKTQVRSMVRRILKSKTLPAAHDVSDALAVAICHAHTAPVRRKWGGE